MVRGVTSNGGGLETKRAKRVTHACYIRHQRVVRSYVPTQFFMEIFLAVKYLLRSMTLSSMRSALTGGFFESTRHLSQIRTPRGCRPLELTPPPPPPTRLEVKQASQ